MHGTAGIPQDPEQSASSLHVSYHDGIWNFLSSEPAFLAPPYLSACRLIAPAVRLYSALSWWIKLSTSSLYVENQALSRVEMEKVSIKAGAEGREALLCRSLFPFHFLSCKDHLLFVFSHMEESVYRFCCPFVHAGHLGQFFYSGFTHFVKRAEGMP